MPPRRGNITISIPPESQTPGECVVFDSETGTFLGTVGRLVWEDVVYIMGTPAPDFDTLPDTLKDT